MKIIYVTNTPKRKKGKYRVQVWDGDKYIEVAHTNDIDNAIREANIRAHGNGYAHSPKTRARVVKKKHAQ